MTYYGVFYWFNKIWNPKVYGDLLYELLALDAKNKICLKKAICGGLASG